MKMIIDGDGCPDINTIINICKDKQIKVIIISDYAHNLQSDYAEVKQVSTGSQNADMYIINNIEKNDILITQDIGLASICLNKCYKVINPKGLIYENETIDNMLLERHINKNLRKQGINTKHKKRSNEDTKNLIDTILKILE